MSFSLGNRNSRQTFSEINITPLTDVFLVLLVIMLLIAPLLDDQGALKVDLPTANNSTKVQKSPDNTPPINIEINQEGEIAINGKIVVAKGDPIEQIYPKVYGEINKISPASTTKTDDDKKPKVRLKADKQTFYGRIIGVYDALQKAKMNNQVGSLVLIAEEPAVAP